MDNDSDIMVEIISTESAYNIVKSAFVEWSKQEDKEDEEDNITHDYRGVQLTLRKAAEATPADYSFKIPKFEILLAVSIDTSSTWDNSSHQYIFFKTSKEELGVLDKFSWAEMTFSGSGINIDICQSGWLDYYNFSLFENTRDIIDGILHPSLGLTSSSPIIRTISEEILTGTHDYIKKLPTLTKIKDLS